MTVKPLHFLAALLLASSAVAADDYAAGWGPAIGAEVSISAQDQSGTARTLGDLTGERGLLLFLNRSADW